MKKVTFKFNKLIRDKIFNAMSADSQQFPNYKKLDNAEFFNELKKKLVEEAKELEKSESAEFLAELADIQQIIEYLLKLQGKSKQDLNRALKAKKSKLGGFDSRIFLFSDTFIESSKWVQAYRRQPDKYEEVEN